MKTTDRIRQLVNVGVHPIVRGGYDIPSGDLKLIAQFTDGEEYVKNSQRRYIFSSTKEYAIHSKIVELEGFRPTSEITVVRHYLYDTVRNRTLSFDLPDERHLKPSRKIKKK